MLCDSSGYTVDFNIYTGKSNVVSGKRLSFDAVMSLVRKEFLGSGYHIYCDHFYTSRYFSSTFITLGLELVEPSGTQGLVSHKPK